MWHEFALLESHIRVILIRSNRGNREWSIKVSN